jgi:hypothetical protein
MATIARDEHPVGAGRQRPTGAEIIHDLRKGAGKVADILAVVVTAAASVFAGILVLYVVFVLFKATPTNSIVKHIDRWAYDLAGPFRTLFAFKNKNHLPNVKLNAAVNYGIAALAYLFGGRILAAALHKLAPAGKKS